MKTDFHPGARPALIGSIPVDDHTRALELIMQHTPEIPLWAQLPLFKKEGMLRQFAGGMPGLTETEDKFFIDTSSENFDAETLSFFEEYLTVTEAGGALSDTRFKLDTDTASGFFTMTGHLDSAEIKPFALKGQITGPLTFGTGITDQDGRAVFYNEQVRDMAVKLIGLKAAWQIKELSRFNVPSIVFFDEPALTGIGSSAFISISKEDVSAAFAEVVDAVHKEGGLAGIHVCANADWSILLDSKIDIISFDAYSYFDRFILYAEGIRKFIKNGGILAIGIVPTLNPDDVDRETAESLFTKFDEQLKKFEEIGLDRKEILDKTLITPSCGTGSLSLDRAVKVLEMTRDLSEMVKSGYDF